MSHIDSVVMGHTTTTGTFSVADPEVGTASPGGGSADLTLLLVFPSPRTDGKAA